MSQFYVSALLEDLSVFEDPQPYATEAAARQAITFWAAHHGESEDAYVIGTEPLF